MLQPTQLYRQYYAQVVTIAFALFGLIFAVMRPLIAPQPFSSGGCYAALAFILFGALASLFANSLKPVYLIVFALCVFLVSKLGGPIPLFQKAAHILIGYSVIEYGQNDSKACGWFLLLLTLEEAACTVFNHFIHHL